MFWHRGTFIAEVAADNETRVALLNLNHHQPLVLQGSAAAIWDLIDGTRTEAEILIELQRMYGTTDGSSMKDQLNAFLHELSHQGLAESREERTEPANTRKASEGRQQ